jgi:tetratricopeptide (TPR) repeat protein
VKAPALLAVLMCGAGLQPCLAAQADARPDERTLVMPFENVKRDASIFWMGEASAVLVTDGLNASGANAITRAERLGAFERLQVPPAAALTDATVIRIGQVVGAAEIVVGSLELDGDMLVVHARRIALEAGRVQMNVIERGPLTDLFAVFDRVAQGLSAAPNMPVPPPREARPPVGAFENYIKGLVAETPSTAINYLRAALAAYPGYDRARLALWDIHAEAGNYDQALAVVDVVPRSSPSWRRARFLAGLAQTYARKYDQAFATFMALSDEETTATVLNNIGVIQLRRGATPQTGLPTYYFDKAAKVDADDPDYYFNLGYAYWEQRDAQAAIYWLREGLRRSPTDGEAHFVLGVVLAAAGNLTESAREKELAKRLSSLYEQWDRRPTADAVPKGLERLKSDVELPHARRIETRIASTEQRDQQQLAEFYLDRGRRLFAQQNDREASAELDRALYLSPYLADAHLLLGRIHLRNGRTREAIEALKIAVWSADTAEGHAVLGQAYLQAMDVASARTESARAVALDSSSSEANRLVDMLKSF